MNSSGSTNSTIQNSSLYDQVALLVARAEGSIRSEGLDKEFGDKLLGSILSAAERIDSEISVYAAIQQMIHDTEKLQAILRDLLRGFEAWRASRIRPEANADDSWQRQSKQLYDTFKRNPKEGTAQWLQHYASALLTWDLDVCNKLVEERFPFPLEATEVSIIFKEGTQALQSEDYLNALKMLDYLVSMDAPSHSQLSLDQTSQALILVLIGRINLYHANDSNEGLKKFEQAKELAPNDGRIYAALGDYSRTLGELRNARLNYQEGIQLSSDEPDGYLGMGLLSDSQKLWDEALNWYRQAAQIALVKFSTLVNRDTRAEDIDHEVFNIERSKHALLYLMRTVNLENKDNVDYRMNINARLLGIILETLRKNNEAAEAYYRSGRIFMQSNEIQAAIDLFAHANNLNDKYMPTYWSIVDAWRIRSLLYQDIEGLKKSLEFWDRGIAIEFPDIPNSWAYVTRALINKQQTQLSGGQKDVLLWEGNSYLERAILLEDAEAYRWTHLSDLYSDLYLRYNALYASEKALESSPNDAISLEKSAVALINLGYLVKAEEAINKILESDPKNVLSQYLKAYILYFKGEYKAAVKFVDEVLKDVPMPQAATLLPLRALCHEMLSQPILAAQDYELIWEQRDHLGSDPSVGWAAYQLGKVDDAINIFNKLSEDPNQAGNAHRDLGLIYIQSGDMVRGEQELIQGLDLAANVQELDELINVTLLLLERSLEQAPFGAEAGQVLNRIKQKIMSQRAELDKPFPDKEQVVVAAEQELVKKLAESKSADWAWVGTRAGLARLYMESKQLDLAANEYLTLLEGDLQNALPRCPEASIGLSKVAREYARLGWQASQRSDLPQTMENFRRGLILRKKAGISISAEDLISDLMNKSADLPHSEQYDILKKAKLELDSGNTF